MKFRIVLLLLGWRLKWLTWRSASFRSRLADRDVVMLLGVKSGAPSGWYRLTPTKVTAKHGLHPAPTFSVLFENADYAFETLKAASKDQAAFTRGVNTGKIKIGGKDPGQLMWFFSLLKYIAP